MNQSMRQALAFCGGMGSVLSVTLVATGPAFGCIPIGPEENAVIRGEQCSVSYVSKDGPSVSSGAAVDLGHGIVRQYISASTNACDIGENIIVYYDCTGAVGVWLGGGDLPMDAAVPPIPDHEPKPILGVESVSEAFIRTEESGFTGDETSETILARAQRLDWVAESGTLSQSRVSVNGHSFDMSCACAMYYRN
ncbi:hypothetical protein JJJ17_05665 [Paracoccus caeni]|uniref:Uncharacterized protein n=1 Tax=Paracoccus caeni TaxID=657651 RepID=A0A934SDL6_9RHOB|nr:hypothetical protein [Paracoccus caeni]MBK4215410.1 hypothetical protein [Paracoccus caeni]